jgi:hypothetical protein
VQTSRRPCVGFGPGERSQHDDHGDADRHRSRPRTARRCADGRVHTLFKLEASPQKPTLFFQFHGSQAGVQEQTHDEGINDWSSGAAPPVATQPGSNGCGRRDTCLLYGAHDQTGMTSFATDACVPIHGLPTAYKPNRTSGGRTDRADTRPR